MKKSVYFLFAVVLVFMTFTFSSCEKNVSDYLGSMSCKIDGKAWNSNVRVTTKYDTRIVVAASTGTSLEDGEVLTISIEGVEEGKYDLMPTQMDFECGVIYKTSDQQFASHEGSVTITEIDTENNKISGTFWFDVINEGLIDSEINITGGSFSNLKYVEP